MNCPASAEHPPMRANQDHRPSVRPYGTHEQHSESADRSGAHTTKSQSKSNKKYEIFHRNQRAWRKYKEKNNNKPNQKNEEKTTRTRNLIKKNTTFNKTKRRNLGRVLIISLFWCRWFNNGHVHGVDRINARAEVGGKPSDIASRAMLRLAFLFVASADGRDQTKWKHLLLCWFLACVPLLTCLAPDFDVSLPRCAVEWHDPGPLCLHRAEVTFDTRRHSLRWPSKFTHQNARSQQINCNI